LDKFAAVKTAKQILANHSQPSTERTKSLFAKLDSELGKGSQSDTGNGRLQYAR
jgi:hypothetical protein